MCQAISQYSSPISSKLLSIKPPVKKRGACRQTPLNNTSYYGYISMQLFKITLPVHPLPSHKPQELLPEDDLL